MSHPASGNSTLCCWPSLQMFPLSVVVFPSAHRGPWLSACGSRAKRSSLWTGFCWRERRWLGRQKKKKNGTTFLYQPFSPTWRRKLPSSHWLVASWVWRGTFTRSAWRKLHLKKKKSRNEVSRPDSPVPPPLLVSSSDRNHWLFSVLHLKASAIFPYYLSACFCPLPDTDENISMRET